MKDLLPGDTAMGFYAHLGESITLPEGVIVVFDNVVTNVGDAYMDITGTFTGNISNIQCTQIISDISVTIYMYSFL